MNLLSFTGTMWAFLALTFSFCFDTRRPMSTKLRYKYRVKDNSIFRKIIKFKDGKFYPCNYFKIVPLYIYLLLAILSSVLVLVDVFTGGFVMSIISQELLLMIWISIFMISAAYFVVINIWWELVDYNEFKFTKAEKEELKKLRDSRKKQKNF